MPLAANGVGGHIVIVIIDTSPLLLIGPPLSVGLAFGRPHSFLFPLLSFDAQVRLRLESSH